jgi:hypothetical protein
VGIADDEPHAGQTPRPEAAQEGRPERAVLAVTDRQAEHLPVAGLRDRGRVGDGLGQDPRPVVGFDIGRVEEDVREGGVPQRSVAELGDDRIELGADPAHLALADPGVDAEGRHQVVDLARADAVDIGLHDDGPEGPVDPSSGFQERREERAGPELGDAQLDITRLRAEQPAPTPVAVGRPGVGPLVPRGADRLVGLELDELLEDEGHRVAHDVGAAAGADGVEQLGQGRL